MTTASVKGSTEGWSPARLIPVAGMKGAKEQEQRATSALLAVMEVVPSFGRAVLRYLDAPSGRIFCFAEPHFTTDEGDTVVPDGLVVVEWGKTR